MQFSIVDALQIDRLTNTWLNYMDERKGLRKEEGAGGVVHVISGLGMLDMVDIDEKQQTAGVVVEGGANEPSN